MAGSISHFNDLPYELKIGILSKVRTKDKGNLSQTCQEWFRLLLQSMESFTSEDLAIRSAVASINDGDDTAFYDAMNEELFLKSLHWKSTMDTKLFYALHDVTENLTFIEKVGKSPLEEDWPVFIRNCKRLKKVVLKGAYFNRQWESAIPRSVTKLCLQDCYFCPSIDTDPRWDADHRRMKYLSYLLTNPGGLEVFSFYTATHYLRGFYHEEFALFSNLRKIELHLARRHVLESDLWSKSTKSIVRGVLKVCPLLSKFSASCIGIDQTCHKMFPPNVLHVKLSDSVLESGQEVMTSPCFLCVDASRIRTFHVTLLTAPITGAYLCPRKFSNVKCVQLGHLGPGTLSVLADVLTIEKVEGLSVTLQENILKDLPPGDKSNSIKVLEISSMEIKDPNEQHWVQYISRHFPKLQILVLHKWTTPANLLNFLRLFSVVPRMAVSLDVERLRDLLNEDLVRLDVPNIFISVSPSESPRCTLCIEIDSSQNTVIYPYFSGKLMFATGQFIPPAKIDGSEVFSDYNGFLRRIAQTSKI